ncbi:S-adenosyl-L-methionine-dependent methyltransferase [Emericellopsis atlantica]|uniref:tRNA (guanine(10)-N(2))-methyltransferase n=1 Tax=Emericellopsis atlantica TaxID=2614577 RepID=A0A9P7ZK20_9HYPO|nr:S-adenosyl-L-methionine-dependent methyltransferase [Emericellopsis atlantica]KAG9253554.1 S-adenosyl-L-methionine-dependent methyltransferase [Emericellopsis atlantica]
MLFLIRFAQIHESFRLAELKALAELECEDLKIAEHDDKNPFCIVEMSSVEASKRVISRSILAQSIHELWGSGSTLNELHEDIKSILPDRGHLYKDASFKFEVECFQGTRSKKARMEIIHSLAYLPFEGPIKMKDPQEHFTIFEYWPYQSVFLGIENPERLYFARFVGGTSRDIVHKYDLKKRGYISTTSMDSELALVTANIALADSGKLFFDPFVGTGSFPIACSHFGATTWGSDIDGRSLRGDGKDKSLKGNFSQYGMKERIGDVFASDLTNTPLQLRRIWDGIVCDPPYGVREGLRVLGCRDPLLKPWQLELSKKNYKEPDYVPPKKPYSFYAMLDNILAFAASTLVDNGRLSFWMPTANDEDREIAIPEHPRLQVVSVCTQVFHKWSRRLITYRRVSDAEVSPAALQAFAVRQQVTVEGRTADELNPFRNEYFKGFNSEK